MSSSVSMTSGIRSMNDGAEQLHRLRTRLMDLQARQEAEPSA
ncbi:hypothetical protein ACFWP3_14110 [Streptomyces sp. NPDC058525]